MKSNNKAKTEHFSFVFESEKESEIITKIRNYKDYGYDSQSDLLRDAAIRFFESDSNKNSLKSRIEYQKYLKLCLENWELLKNKGHIFEEAKAIITQELELVAPSTDQIFQQKTEKGLDQFGTCSVCHHKHVKSEPRVCTELHCNCGVRG